MTGATTATSDTTDLASALEALDAALRAAVPGPTDGPGVAAERAALLRLLDGYVRPRVGARPPLVAVLFGAAGTGKSTLLNSLARDAIGTPSAVRPGTRRAAVHDDPGGVSLVDAPPPEVAGDDGESAVDAWLAAADLGIHVASAARYADAAGWAPIRTAARRGLPLLFVLNRLPAGDDAGRLLADYAARLHDAGYLPSSDAHQVVPVPAGDTGAGHGGLPEAAVAELATRLSSLDPAAAQARALDGALAALAGRVAALAEVLGAGGATAAELRATAHEPYEAAGDRLGRKVAAGGLAPVAGGEWEEQRDAVTRLVAHTAGRAAQQAAAAWDATAAGRRLLAERPSLWRHGPGIEEQTAERLEEWLDVLGAAAKSRFRRWWALRKRLALADTLRLAALGGPDDVAAPAGTAGAGAAALLDGARADLAATLRDALGTDAARFAAAAGDPAAAADRADELAAAGRALAAAMAR